MTTTTTQNGSDTRRQMPLLPSTKSAGTDTLQHYLKQVASFPLLSQEEEQELARRVLDQDDSEAALRLVTSHLRLAVKIAMEFQRIWMRSVLDLIQEGNVGLLQAVKKFDPDKGVRFSYYATFWIRAYIMKFIRDNWRMVKLGTTQPQRRLFYNLGKERRRLQQQGYDTDNATLAANLGVSEEEVSEMLQRMDAPDMSLDAPVKDEQGASHMELLPALGPGVEEEVAASERSNLARRQIDAVLPELNDKEADILRTRLLTDSPETLREIGERHGVSRERIRQLEERLVSRLRERMQQEYEDLFEEQAPA